MTVKVLDNVLLVTTVLLALMSSNVSWSETSRRIAQDSPDAIAMRTVADFSYAVNKRLSGLASSRMSRGRQTTVDGEQCTSDPRVFVDFLRTSHSPAKLSITSLTVLGTGATFQVTADVHWVLPAGRQRVAAEYKEQFEIALVEGTYMIVAAPLTDGLMCSWIKDGNPHSWLSAHTIKRYVGP